MSAVPKVKTEKLSLYLLAQQCFHECAGDFDKAVKSLSKLIADDEEYVAQAIHQTAQDQIGRASAANVRRAFSTSFAEKRSPVMDVSKVTDLPPGEARGARQVPAQTRYRSPTYLQPVDELEQFLILNIKIRELRAKDLRRSISMRTSRRATDLRVMKFQTELLKLIKGETKTLGQSTTDTDIWSVIRKHNIHRADL